MPSYTMIYLGNFPDMDPDESSINSELATTFAANGSIGDSGTPLYARVLDVSLNDSNNDGRIYHDNYCGTQETISYQLGDPPVTHHHQLDGAFVASNVEVTRLLPDGSTDTVLTTVRVFQDTSGNAFMIPPPVNGGAPGEVDAVTTYPLVGLSFPSASHFTTNLGIASADRYNLKGFVKPTAPCFTAGTLILTDRGGRPVEDLAPGDLVWTRDNGFQPIRWSGQRSLSPAELGANPRLRPIRIRAGALGPSRPDTDLIVSPQHRVLVRSRIAQRMFGAPELLVAAKQLVGIAGVEELYDCASVTYVHLLFDRHEVLMSNGAETESLFPGVQALAALGDAAEEIRALFPQLRDDGDAFQGARLFAAGKRARHLAQRHAANGQPLVS
ncbi:Hint domain-containing protein [Paracoccus salsus]|uniref:Hint domain-containing protein n=1 Tax=Paracoccus salsus TaxID=2911061 RepID=UPI001F2BC95D|nr:Hint domain-containing protein [Paracoccus salsus]MCF3972547.1 Hint domain-containing protein [Paracoccus salsus]